MEHDFVSVITHYRASDKWLIVLHGSIGWVTRVKMESSTVFVLTNLPPPPESNYDLKGRRC